LSDGQRVEATITGIGADAPALRVVPGVAANGQVVTVRGVGFPTGATVELLWADNGLAEQVVVSDAGDFVETVVIMPHTRRGPSEIVVRGQEGLFGDVVTEILISSGRGLEPAILNGPSRPVRP
jgi:hypothetical protein